MPHATNAIIKNAISSKSPKRNHLKPVYDNQDTQIYTISSAWRYRCLQIHVPGASSFFCHHKPPNYDQETLHKKS